MPAPQHKEPNNTRELDVSESDTDFECEITLNKTKPKTIERPVRKAANVAQIVEFSIEIANSTTDAQIAKIIDSSTKELKAKNGHKFIIHYDEELYTFAEILKMIDNGRIKINESDFIKRKGNAKKT